MPPIRCRTCGAEGQHLTHKCPQGNGGYESASTCEGELLALSEPTGDGSKLEAVVAAEATEAAAKGTEAAVGSEVRVRFITMSGLEFIVLMPRNATVDDLKQCMENASGLEMFSHNLVLGMEVLCGDRLLPLSEAPEEVCIQVVHDAWGSEELDLDLIMVGATLSRDGEWRSQYQALEATVSGEGECPAPFTSFRSCNFPCELQSFLKARGLKTPTALQAYCWPVAASGRDLMCISTTGSGRTLAYIVHAILQLYSAQQTAKYPKVLGLVPTRELCFSVHAEIESLTQKLGLTSICIVGGVPIRPQIEALMRGVHILMSTPGRLVDMLERGVLQLDCCEHVVFEDIDRMVDMGSEPQLRETIAALPRKRQTMCFTSTFAVPVQRLCVDLLTSPVQVRISRVQA